MGAVALVLFARHLAIRSFAILATLTPCASPAKPMTPLVALGTLLGAAEEAMAMMNHCRVADPEKRNAYDGLAFPILQLYTPYYKRANQILPTEALRAGFPDGNRFKGAFLINLRQLAQTEIKERVATLTATQDIVSCREELTDFQQHKGLFALPTVRFPAESRVVERWR